MGWWRTWTTYLLDFSLQLVFGFDGFSNYVVLILNVNPFLLRIVWELLRLVVEPIGGASVRVDTSRCLITSVASLKTNLRNIWHNGHNCGLFYWTLHWAWGQLSQMVTQVPPATTSNKDDWSLVPGSLNMGLGCVWPWIGVRVSSWHLIALLQSWHSRGVPLQLPPKEFGKQEPLVLPLL